MVLMPENTLHLIKSIVGADFTLPLGQVNAKQLGNVELETVGRGDYCTITD